MPEQDTKAKKYRRIGMVVGSLLVLAGLIAAVVWLFVLPYQNAQSNMTTDSVLTLQHRQDGSVELSWPAAAKTDFYQVEVLHRVETEAKSGERELRWETVHAAQVADTTAYVLPELPWDEELTIRINTMVYYDFPGEDKVRPGETPLETTLRLESPAVENLTWTADPDADSVTLTFDVTQGEEARLYWCDGQDQWQLLRTVEEEQITLTFGEGKDLPMLEHGQTCRLRMDAIRRDPGSEYYGRLTDEIVVIREDLLDSNLVLQLTGVGDNVCTLVWNETKGETYELQMKQQEEEWVTIHTVDQTGDRIFTTEHLKAFRAYQFRVVALGGQAALSETGVVSDTQEFRTREAVLYSTIWPIKDLEVFDSPDMTQSIGKVTGGSTLCVVQVCEGAFGIRYAEGVTGYIDSNYCMIDLVDYLGELCAYDITNSYSSKYMIHRYSMPQITGTVIVGYENVRMADGTYLAPLLYPVAQKLLVAAQSAYDAGYRLKIYDSYRPNRATVMLYNRAENMLEQPVPGNIKDPTEEDPDRLLTYGKVMTDDQYPLTFFLAQGGSLHNQGIAVDLSMELRETGEEQPMQSNMHDLSYFSMIYRNNDNANLLKGFMESAGLVGLTTEWWHFQDDAIRKELVLPFLWGGVSPEGWKLDDTGWRYRLSDGTYAADCTKTIEETEYAFDTQGYLKEN